MTEDLTIIGEKVTTTKKSSESNNRCFNYIQIHTTTWESVFQ